MTTKPVSTVALSPNGPTQINAVADFVVQGWRFRSGTSTERSGLDSDEKFDGLVWADKDNGRGIYQWDGSGWLPITRAMTQKIWTFARASASTSDVFPGGSFAGLISGTITAAPAGDYEVSASLILKAAAATDGNMQVLVGATNLSGDMQAGVATVATPVVFAPRRITWAGGDMVVGVSQLCGVDCTIYKAGSFITVKFVSP